jgi:hypothetical protein
MHVQGSALHLDITTNSTQQQICNTSASACDSNSSIQQLNKPTQK